MTITYHAGRRIQGLSNDIVETPTLDDNFSSYTTQASADASWIPVSGTNIRVDVTNDYILHTCTVGTVQEIIYYDLGLISDTSWVLRFSKYTVTQGTSDSHIYISSVAGANNVVTQDFIGVINNGGANNYGARIKDSTVIVDSVDSFTEANSNGSTFYFELIRLSSSAMLFRRYTDSTYTTVVETSNISTGMTGVINLRYLTFCTNDDNNGETQSIYRYDDIKFYNGVTSLTSKPTNVQIGSRFEATDTRKIYFYKDPLTLDYGFPDSTNWNTEGTSGKMTISGGKLSFSSNAQNIDARQWYPLGFSVTGNFIMDFTLTQNTATPVASGQAVTVQIGISSFNTGASGEVPSTSAYTQLVISDYPSGDAYISAHKGDGTWLNDTPVRNWGFVTTNSTPIIRYIRISRVNNALTFKAYSDSTRLTQVGSTLSGLSMSNTFNYLFLKVYTQASSNSWNFDLDDIKFYNGTTSTDTWTEEV